MLTSFPSWELITWTSPLTSSVLIPSPCTSVQSVIPTFSRDKRVKSSHTFEEPSIAGRVTFGILEVKILSGHPLYALMAIMLSLSGLLNLHMIFISMQTTLAAKAGSTTTGVEWIRILSRSSNAICFSPSWIPDIASYRLFLSLRIPVTLKQGYPTLVPTNTLLSTA